MGWYSGALKRLGEHRWFARTASWAAPPVDRFVHRLTRGRRMATPKDLPALMLTTTGRVSGEERTVPLLYLDDDDGFVVAGTNWGGSSTPEWVLNLEADPRAVVEVDRERSEVRAEAIAASDQASWWKRFEAMWPAYRTYRERADHREVRVFRLRARG